MPALTDPITFGSVTIDGGSGGNWIERLLPRRVQGSLKNRFNENVTITEIPGRAKEWLLEINGWLSGGSRDGDENTLSGYDDGSIRGYTDGKHNGNYIILELEFTHENRSSTAYPYRLVIRQYTQAV